MIQEDYCSYEVSKLLKERGFDWPCHGSYHIYPKSKIVWTPKPVNDDGQIFMNAPTHQMAIKWLRERHIIIVIVPEYFESEQCVSWDIDIWTGDNYKHLFDDYSTYEEAVEASLKYCLTQIIQ